IHSPIIFCISALVLQSTMEEDTALIEPDSTTNHQGCFERLLNFFRGNKDDAIDASPVLFFKLFRFSTRREILLYFFAAILSALTGFMIPVHIYIGSRLTTIYVTENSPIGNDEFLWRVWYWGSLFLVSFFFAMIIEYAQFYLLAWASERTAQR
ncbi:hypothetical protein PENTCL1PPCAC_17176, partial [Pristionchus entomophagus]